MESFTRIILAILVLLITSLYYYIIITNQTRTQNNKKELFYNISRTVSEQLTKEIAVKLGISVRRIKNITYTGDMNQNRLNVSFTIIDPNIIEINNGEPNTLTASNNANELFYQNRFTVNINGNNIMLYKINQTSRDSNENISSKSLEKYFNNTGLLDISDYADQKYKIVSNDSSMTRFYKLELDSNYNIKPVL
jgi:hypothetical protein